MKELSIFVDESGDFGEYNHHSPYYIIAMVFHDQKDDLTYRLFPMADLICTLELMRLKMDNKIISKHELLLGVRKVAQTEIKQARMPEHKVPHAGYILSLYCSERIKL